MLLAYELGLTSVRLRVRLTNSSTGAAMTGLTSASSGLIISTIADNEATATVYAQASSNIEGITTLGTFAAPTASKCRFKEVDATNHPGVYEIQIADARFNVSNARSLLISISGVSNLLDCHAVIQQKPVPSNLTQTNGTTTSVLDEVDGITVETFFKVIKAFITGKAVESPAGTWTFYAEDNSTVIYSIVVDADGGKAAGGTIA